MIESKNRSLVKGITWRIIGTVDTIMLAFLITGDIRNALKIGWLELFTKTILFFLHERIWLTFTSKERHFSKTRSIKKAISWRITGTIDTIVLSFLVLTFSGQGDIKIPPIYTASTIGLAELFTKMILYYFHDRIWLRVKWGLR
jgi:uncharacterized membrane protein